MSTNYYMNPPPSCGGKCDRHCRSEEIHLGKSSAGWTFTFQAYPDPQGSPEAITWPVTDYASWLKLLDLGQITDEYGRDVTRQEMLNLVKNKRGSHSALYGADFYDSDGNRFVDAEFS